MSADIIDFPDRPPSTDPEAVEHFDKIAAAVEIIVSYGMNLLIVECGYEPQAALKVMRQGGHAIKAEIERQAIEGANG